VSLLSSLYWVSFAFHGSCVSMLIQFFILSLVWAMRSGQYFEDYYQGEKTVVRRRSRTFALLDV